jgi:hypothetical protein
MRARDYVGTVFSADGNAILGSFRVLGTLWTAKAEASRRGLWDEGRVLEVRFAGKPRSKAATFTAARTNGKRLWVRRYPSMPAVPL